jgi:uncharacterized protein
MTTPDTPSTPSSTAALASRADVPTDVPGRYAKQLVSHLGRKVEFVEDRGSWTADVNGSVARITVGDGVLVLEAEASDTESLARMEHALGSHLERFGQRNELRVAWQRSGTAPA